MSIKSVMPSNHLILCCLLLLPPSIFSSIRVFSNESVLCLKWPKYWGSSCSISPYNEYSGLISFRMDWLYLLAGQTIYNYNDAKFIFTNNLPFLTKRLSELMTGKYTELLLSLLCAFFPLKSPYYSLALFLLLRYGEGTKKAPTMF